MRNRKLSLGTAVIAVVLMVLGLNTQSLAQSHWDQRYWNTMRKTDVEKVIARRLRRHR